MDNLIVALFQGIGLGGVYALVGLGLVLVWKATTTFSFTHGQLMLLPAFLVGVWQASGLMPWWLAIVCALAISTVIGVFFYLVVMQRTIGMPHFMGFIATLGLASILDGLIRIFFGNARYPIDIPFLPDGSFQLGGVQLSLRVATLTVATVILAVGIALVIRYTDVGIRLRAAGNDPILASQGGIRVRRIYAGSWALAALLAGIAGIAYGSGNIVDASMQNLALAAFPAILLGGLDSIGGAVVGGMIVGALQGFVAMYFGAEYVSPVTYLLLLVVLLVRPQGLLGTREVQRV